MLRDTLLPNHLRPRREKVFGPGPRVPLDRNAKTRVKEMARALLRKTEAGRHYGVVTAKALAVLDALLWGFHNAKDGRCDPSYEAIAKRADCARSTVSLAIKALELAGVLSWVNRIIRERDHERDLFGHWVTRWRITRTSNAYLFRDPQPGASLPNSSKSEIRSGTPIPESISTLLNPDDPLERALLRLGRSLNAIPEGAG
jgi:hypothetical protein